MDRIQYFELPELPGRKMFRCEKRQATIGVEPCASMWKSGHAKGAHERFWLCQGCPTGAVHAGVAEASLSPLYAKTICERCHRGATRLIHGHKCVSCYNREREYLLGRNARGNAPVTHPRLYRLSLRYRAGGVVKTTVRERVADPLELVVAALRDEAKQVTFAMMPPRSPLPQMELFA